MKLYRAVSPIELDDIRVHHGAFRDSPHQSGEKGFFFQLSSARDMARWASTLNGEDHTVVETDAPESVIARGRPHPVAHEGSGVYLLVSDLEQLTPAVEV
jgi:hypothetical protein